ncbi:MAG: virulence RhuM family protein [Bacteroidetes bacterium]|nr:virulence RhuM family protein [Bacteroidota bacterium]
MQNETVWLSQAQIADLFQTDRSSITKHIGNIFESGELDESATCAKFAQVQKEGRRSVSREVNYYNLDVIISVGYRVQSSIATRFRIWATQRLKEYIIKGFVLDDERLKLARNNYFDELLSRIRDIRSSEKVFYRKVCEIYATSSDYEPSQQKTLDFFASVQNKFHWAVTGKTAAEILIDRADSKKPNMGLTNWPGETIKKQDTEVAKNYLNTPELDQLNRLVNQYLEFAELQAINRKVMHMDDWIGKLHGFLTLNEKQILKDAGRISAQLAREHVHHEYEKYQKLIEETHLDELDKALKRLEKDNLKD